MRQGAIQVTYRPLGRFVVFLKPLSLFLARFFDSLPAFYTLVNSPLPQRARTSLLPPSLPGKLAI
jgi:hypothetical protein